MEKISIRQILQDTPNFGSIRPAFYAGRGAIATDLDYKKLTHINEQIQKHFGLQASQNFVKMVSQMPECNCTDFLNNCFLLENRDFVWTSTPEKFGMETDKDKDGNYNMNHGIMAVTNALARGSLDETDQIRNLFLTDNGIKVKGRIDSWYK